MQRCFAAVVACVDRCAAIDELGAEGERVVRAGVQTKRVERRVACVVALVDGHVVARQQLQQPGFVVQFGRNLNEKTKHRNANEVSGVWQVWCDKCAYM